MKLSESAGALADAAGDVLVVDRYAGEARFAADVVPVDRALGGLLTRALAEERFEARVGETSYVHAAGPLGVTRVLVVGLGPRGECTTETVRRAASAAARRARDLGARRLVMRLLGAGGSGGGRIPTRTRAQAQGEGVLLGLYSFDRYKSSKDGRAVESLTVVVPEAGDRRFPFEPLP